MIAVINGWDFAGRKKVNLAETKEKFSPFMLHIEWEGEFSGFLSGACQNKIVEWKVQFQDSEAFE